MILNDNTAVLYLITILGGAEQKCDLMICRTIQRAVSESLLPQHPDVVAVSVIEPVTSGGSMPTKFKCMRPSSR